MIIDLISPRQQFYDEEYLGRYLASFQIQYTNSGVAGLVKKLFELIPNRDKLKVTIKSTEIDDFIILNDFDEQKLLRFIKDTSIVINDLLLIELEITKNLMNGKLSIYSFEAFQTKICELPLLQVMRSMSNYLKEIDTIFVFEVMQENFHSISTKYISFSPFTKGLQLANTVSRKVKLSRVGYLGHFFNFSDYTLLPEDFQFTSFEQNKLTNIFHKIATILSIAYICYESDINDQQITVRISNDKVQKLRMDIERVQYIPPVVDLYNWILADDNYLDKVSITRNILSQNLTDTFVVDSEIIDIIQKTYNIAIKEKIDEFFEVKRETAEFIKSTLSELSQVYIIIVEKFIYNIFAIGIFLSTTLLPTFIETKKLDSIFTADVRLIIRISMIGSIIFCILTNIRNYFIVRNYTKTLIRLEKNFSEYYSKKELAKIFDVKKLGNIKMKIVIFSALISLFWIGLSVWFLNTFK